MYFIYMYVSEQTGFGPEKVLITNNYHALSLTAAAALPGHSPELLAVRVKRRWRTHRRRRRRRRVLQPRMHGGHSADAASESSTAADSSDLLTRAN